MHLKYQLYYFAHSNMPDDFTVSGIVLPLNGLNEEEMHRNELIKWQY